MPKGQMENRLRKYTFVFRNLSQLGSFVNIYADTHLY